MDCFKRRPLVSLCAVLFSCFCLAEGGGSVISRQAQDKTYLKECGACHLAYQPQFLPKRSWEKLLGALDNHFGDSAALDEAARSEILAYVLRNSAESSPSPISRSILASLGPAEVPTRITGTQFFKRRHREVRAEVFQRKGVGSPANCTGCHTAAETGDYNEDLVKIPKN